MASNSSPKFLLFYLFLLFLHPQPLTISFTFPFLPHLSTKMFLNFHASPLSKSFAACLLSSARFSLSPKPDLSLPVVILSLSSDLFQVKHLLNLLLESSSFWLFSLLRNHPLVSLHQFPVLQHRWLSVYSSGSPQLLFMQILSTQAVSKQPPCPKSPRHWPSTPDQHSIHHLLPVELFQYKSISPPLPFP